MVDNEISQYVDLISDKVGKSMIETKIKELQMYTVKSNSESNRMNEKICLNYECLSVIAKT